MMDDSGDDPISLRESIQDAIDAASDDGYEAGWLAGIEHAADIARLLGDEHIERKIRDELSRARGIAP